MNKIIMLIEAFFLVSALSIDAFIASFSYGSNKIKIPFLSVCVIDITCSLIFGASLVLGSLVRDYIPDWLTVTLCFGILFILGLVKLLDSFIKSLIKKYNNLKGTLKFSLFHFKFVLNVYANPEDADFDKSKTISVTEAVSLSIAISLDGLAVGFGAVMGDINGWILFFCSLITTALAIVLGVYFGNRLTSKIPFNISWLSGLVLLILAFTKLF